MGNGPSSTDTSGATSVRRPPRRWPWVALVLVVGLGYATLLIVAPSLSRPKVERAGLRLYRCEALGGSNPPSFRGAIGLAPGQEIGAFAVVHEGDVVYVAGVVTDAAGTDLGAAVWTAEWRGGGPVAPIRAANDLARSVAASPGGSDDDASSGLVGAAASCATRS